MFNEFLTWPFAQGLLICTLSDLAPRAGLAKCPVFIAVIVNCLGERGVEEGHAFGLLNCFGYLPAMLQVKGDPWQVKPVSQVSLAVHVEPSGRWKKIASQDNA